MQVRGVACKVSREEELRTGVSVRSSNRMLFKENGADPPANVAEVCEQRRGPDGSVLAQTNQEQEYPNPHPCFLIWDGGALRCC